MIKRIIQIIFDHKPPLGVSFSHLGDDLWLWWRSWHWIWHLPGNVVAVIVYMYVLKVDRWIGGWLDGWMGGWTTRIRLYIEYNIV